MLRASAENPGWRVERSSSGELLMTPPTGGASSKRNGRLTRLLDEWAERHGFVAFDSDGGFRLPDTSVVSPDGALIKRAAWEGLSPAMRERLLPLVPDVAVEIASPTDEARGLKTELQRLRTLGCGYVILIDPYDKTLWTDGIAPAGFDLDLSQQLE